MKKSLLFIITVVAVMISGSTLMGQGMEDFNNAALTTTYADGSFVGNNNITWSYKHSRDEGDYPIEGKGIMLRRADEPSSLSATFTNGIGNFTVDTRKAFTGNTQRKLELVINGNVVAQFQPTFADGASAEILPFVVNDINIPGNIELTLRLFGAIGNQQLILDNIEWTGFDGEITSTSNPTFTPAAGTYYDQVTTNITSATEGAVINYSTESAEGPWTIYTEPLTFTQTTTVYAYATKAGLDDSKVVSATYTIKPTIEVTTLAELRQKEAGDVNTYRYTGEAVITFQHQQRNSKYIQDATAAIKIDDLPGILGTQLNQGDKITNLIGTRTAYASMEQFVPVANTVVVVSQDNEIVPLVLTFDQITADHQAQLVKINKVSFEQPATFANGTNYTVSDATGTSTLRTPSAPANLDYLGTDTPDGPRNITAVVEQFNTTMQITPRRLSDFEITSSVNHPSTTRAEVYPNPANGSFTVSASAVISNIEIADITGKVVFKNQVNDTQASVNATLDAGIYIVRIYSDDQIIVRKLQIQK